MKSGDLELQLALCLVWANMVTVEYAEEARFFPQRVILRVASTAAMFYISKELDDPPSGRFWTLTPDGDLHPEMLLIPSATGLVWLDGKDQPILTTMMLAGHRLVRVYRFGAQMRIFSPEVIVWAVFVDLETEVTCEEYETHGLPVSSTSVAAPVTSPGRRIASELEELGSKVLAVEMKAGRERQSSLEKCAGAPPACGQKK